MNKNKQMSIEIDKNQFSTNYLLIFNNVFKKIGKHILIILLLCFLNVGANSLLISDPTSTGIKNGYIYEYNQEFYPVLVRERLREHLINDVKNYMDFIAPTSKINPELLVTKCQEYNIDIIFVLSQGILESHLGTRGKARITNSVFNVGAFDNGKVTHTYKHANESIEPYLQLLKEEYLGDKKEISDLIKDKSFKNLKGYRYATYPNYERSLRTIMLHVDMQTSISMYEDIINLSDEKILSYFSPDIIENNQEKLLTNLDYNDIYKREF